MENMETKESRFNIGMLVHSIIGIAVMLLGRFVPPPGITVPINPRLQSLGFAAENGHHLVSISPEGMVVIGLFFGVIYLWTFVDAFWPSFLGVVLYGMTTHVPCPAALNKFMGNPMIVMMFFLFMFAAILMRSNISAYLARWFMTHRITQGRPWVFTAMILVGTYCVAMFEQTTACFLIWPALYIVFNHIGVKKGDKYVTLMIVNTMMMALLCFATDPFKGGAFVLLSNINHLSVSGNFGQMPQINLACYLVFSLVICAVSIGAILFTMKFIYRVDVSPLNKITPEMLKGKDLPPFSIQQKCIVGLLFLLTLWMLLPGIIGRGNALGAFLSANQLGGSLVIIFLATFIRIGGKPLADIQETNAVFPWRTFILVATAVTLGGAMTDKSTNVTVFMEFFLKTHLAGLNELTLTVLIVVLALLVTNFCNSVVAGFIFTPVILALAGGLGFNPAPIMVCFFFMVLIAAVTPAASPFAAIMFDNQKWVSSRDVAVNALISSVIVLVVVVVVGIPLAKLLF